MPTATEDLRSRIVDAFLGRLSTTLYQDIELADVAADAGVSLADLRSAFDGRRAILEAFRERIDAAVLGADDPVEGVSGRDRLFDVLMRRLDALAPYREASRMLLASVRRDPMVACALNAGAVRSMTFMLAAAKVPTAGAMGRLRAQGLAVAYARILDVFVDDTDPGLAKTMVAVDKELARGERLLGIADRLCCAVRRMDERMRSRRGSNRAAAGDEVVAGEGI